MGFLTWIQDIVFVLTPSPSICSKNRLACMSSHTRKAHGRRTESTKRQKGSENLMNNQQQLEKVQQTPSYGPHPLCPADSLSHGRAHWKPARNNISPSHNPYCSFHRILWNCSIWNLKIRFHFVSCSMDDRADANDHNFAKNSFWNQFCGFWNHYLSNVAPKSHNMNVET